MDINLIIKNINRLGFQANQVLDLIEINGGLHKPEDALLIAKGLKYDVLQAKFEFLESAYYKLEEEYDKIVQELIELENEC
jgi:hypothetical protein